MYKLSRDYKKLYEKICNGSVVVAFVDYNFLDGEPPCRDICKIERLAPYTITIGARGISYGDIYPFMEKRGSEADVFESNCQAINLAWIQ